MESVLDTSLIRPHMKILFLAPQPFFRERGTPIRARQFVTAMGKAGHEVDILCYPFGDDIKIPGVTIHRSPRVPFIRDVKVGPSLAKFPLDFFFCIKAFWMCLRHRYVVIDAVEESAFFAVWLKRIFKCSLVYHLDSLISHQLEYSGFLSRRSPLLRLVRWIETRTMVTATACITVCVPIEEQIQQRAPNTRSYVIEDAPLFDTVPEMGKKSSDIRKRCGIGDHYTALAVYTGNSADYQGVELMLEAMGVVHRQHPELRLAVVGPMGRKEEALKAMCSRLGIEDCTLFVGVRPMEEIPAWLEAGDMLLSPRIAGTNTPLKVYSYMQSHSPIVATDLPVNTNVLSASTAVLTPPDAEGFARGMIKLLLHPHIGKRCAHHATVLVQEKYSLARFRRQVEEVIAYVSESRKNQAAG